MSKNKIKKRGSFASYRDKNYATLFRCNIDEMVRKLSKNWGDIQLTLTHTRAFEIHLLAIAYLDAQKEIKSLKSELAEKDVVLEFTVRESGTSSNYNLKCREVLQKYKGE